MTAPFPPGRPRAGASASEPLPIQENAIFLALSSDSQHLTVGALSLGFLIISMGIHEAAHAWMAWRCGDSTAKDMGRMTLDPVKHIDPFMSILLPAILFLSKGMMFGGAKPVPVAYHRLRNPARDMMLVALAGPISNFLLAIVFTVIWKVLTYVVGMDAETVAIRVMDASVKWNLLLAAFNMLPIPPLDGSRVINYLLPESMRDGFAVLERFGLILVFVIIFFTGVYGAIIRPAMLSMLDAADFLTGGIW